MHLQSLFTPPAGLVRGANDDVAFALQQGDQLFVPYGSYPHNVGLQIFNRDSAQKMAGALRSEIGQTRAGLVTAPGRPVYKGHPDVPGRPDTNPAAPAIGWVTGIAAGNDGASFMVKWTPAGQACINSGEFRFYSPHWNMEKVPGGLRPVDLVSIGLTNNPRIPVPAIANDAPPRVVDASAERLALVADIRAEKRCSHDAAWHVARQRRPELFAAPTKAAPSQAANDASFMGRKSLTENIRFIQKKLRPI